MGFCIMGTQEIFTVFADEEKYDLPSITPLYCLYLNSLPTKN